jgi:DNA-binding protein HU-beta
MTKSEISNLTAGDTGVDQQTAARVIDSFLENLKRAAANGEDVFFRGFGSFMVKKRGPKTARNISKGTVVRVPAKNVVRFKPSPEFTAKQD